MEQMSLFAVPQDGMCELSRGIKAAITESASRRPDPFAGLPALRAVWPALTITFPLGDVGVFEANLAAIETLKRVESENRPVTDEERAVLNRYSGWGRLGQKLASYMDGWRDRRKQLHALLTDEEREQVEASVNNAFYTPNGPVQAIWKIVAGLGFKGGKVLDPSTGTGFFLGAMPQEIAARADVTAIDVDSISTRITRALYGPYGVKVLHTGFEAADLVEGSYDLVVTNVPFGDFGVTDRSRVPYRKFHIHDYFFAKALDMVRPGGLVACVTSAFTMDKRSTAVRAYLATKARLLGAFRMPVQALKPGGCEVTTDVVVLQRLGPGVEPNGSEWVESSRCLYERTDSAYHRNQWLVAHPERVIGETCLVSGRYGKVVGTSFEGDLDAELAAQVGAFASLGTVYQPRAQRKRKGPAEVTPTRADAEGVEVKALPGSFIVRDDGSLWIREASGLVAHSAAGKTAARIRGLAAIRDVARELVAAQVNIAVPEPALVRLRGKLNQAYDVYVRKFGFVSEQANQRALAGDPSLSLLLALEHRNGATGKMEKTDLFTRRTAGAQAQVEHCESVADAVVVSQQELGGIDAARIAELLNVEEDVAQRAVLEARLGFVNPVTLELEMADLYLSGNVRAKLREAKNAGEAFAANVTALEKVLPKDLAPGEITASLGSVWIPGEDYEAWLKETFDADLNVERSATAGAFSLKGGARSWCPSEGAVRYKTSRIDAFTLVEQAMNQQVPTVRDPVEDAESGKRKYVVNRNETLEARAKQEELKAAFVEWVWKDADRATRLARLYNDAFNNIARWEPDGSHLTLPGFTQFVTPRPHQKNGVWRIVAGDRNALLAHVVGAGKTLTMAMAGMELRRLGKARKPMYVVPNNVLEQFAAEFVRAYPGANILVAGKKDFQGDKRRLLLARIATGDWDAVLITHPMFEKISLSAEYTRNFIEGMLAQIMAELDNEDTRSLTFKELQKQKKVWQTRLDRLADDTKKDKVLAFDELGIDWLFVDEAHRFKVRRAKLHA